MRHNRGLPIVFQLLERRLLVSAASRRCDRFRGGGRRFRLWGRLLFGGGRRRLRLLRRLLFLRSRSGLWSLALGLRGLRRFLCSRNRDSRLSLTFLLVSRASASR